MYRHEIEKNGESYNVSLFSRWYFMKKKIVEVAIDMESEDDARKLCGMLDNSFKAGAHFGKGVKNAKV